MNWLMIVLVAGNFHFVKMTDTQESCEKMGVFYTQGIEHVAEYICVTPEALKDLW
jgi:hypothetical protein